MESSYPAVYESWKSDPNAFWARAAAGIDWFSSSETICDADMGVYGRWFPGWTTNVCHNCIDRHVASGRGDQTAIIYDSPVTATKEHWTYAAVLAEVQALASVFHDLGIVKGDRIIIYMPMVPQALFAMLAAARIGAVHSVVFGGFAASELALRIDDSAAKLIVSASCGVEPAKLIAYKPLVDAAILLARHKPLATLVLQRPMLLAAMSEHDIDFRAAVEAAKRRGTEIDCVPVEATDPHYILYTSGTTGQPKGVVRDTGGHIVALMWSMENIFGIKAAEVFWAASDIGWVVGHSYIVYAPLLNGSTTVLFEGKPVGTPDAGAFWRVASEHKVSALFTAPTALRAIRKDDPDGLQVAKYDLGDLRTLFLAGERSDPGTLQWAEAVLKVPVVDNWWQTETGWPIAANPVGLGLLPVKHGSPTVPMPGYDVRVLDDTGLAVAPGTLGNVVIKLPLPPSCLPTLWQADERFHAAYLEEFPGYYKTSDAGYVDEDGYIFVMGRTDDIINVAGHRLSTGAMEEVCGSHPDVAECAIVGIGDALKGHVPAGFIVLKAHVSRESTVIEQEIVALVRDQIGPVAAFKLALCVRRLPKTRSGKILRGTIQKIADGETWTMPPTIDDPTVLDEISEVLRARGFGV
ncbi:propionyl-CoA synthetase [Pararhizobium sp.]|uniref:propionyl-CoA synthetase n=1 Tax=Pararhizobium sp. TaxID=1977563 RepID=UPI002726E7AD|nr:propionyl-CoA synthetase [Pararhizobium sp.]MDO9416785.1 propionyl-CoA synthetase [Pararhizobium sp.]